MTISAGGYARMPSPRGDHLVAFALPEATAAPAAGHDLAG
jgi:hypothetical protein|tara:strand:+ start:251 stop:370 length:120 start_codon:yes stop_codon:yes gene_type:complete